MPGTASRSSGSRNPPLRWRNSTILPASSGPIPGSCTSSSSPARFRSISPRCERLADGTDVRARCGASRETDFSPSPTTRSRSSRDPKGPFSRRSRTIAEAFAGPIPGSRLSSVSSAKFGSSRSPAASGTAARSSRRTPSSTVVRRPAADVAVSCVSDGGRQSVSAGPGPKPRRRPVPTSTSAVAVARDRVSIRFSEIISSWRIRGRAQPVVIPISGGSRLRVSGDQRTGSIPVSVRRAKRPNMLKLIWFEFCCRPTALPRFDHTSWTPSVYP